MSDLFKLRFDLGPLTDLEERMRTSLSDILREEGENLAMQAHAHLLELASAELHSRRDKFVKGLKFEQVSEHTWMISVPEQILWIEDGLPENSPMLDHLLQSPKAKTAKDGSKYLVVPFEQNSGKTDNTDYGREMRVVIQRELAKRKIPFDRIERNENGSAKLGLLHQVAIPDSVHPLKTDAAGGPGKGKGPVGQPKQGRTGVPFLSGLRVYQRMAADAFGRPRVNRHIMTFRVASSKQDRGTDWVHPGSAPMKFLDRTYDWAVKEWEEKIKAQILKRLTD